MKHGKRIGDIGAAGDSGGSSQQETPLESQMISTVVGVAMGSISTLVTKNLPVDVFELQAGGELGFEEAQLRVGKRITRDWLLFYSLDLGATKDASSGELVENMNELTSEYAITPWLLWEVKVGDAGQGATELMFRWRF